VRLSIRWRLTLWNSLALAVVLLGFAALVYSLVHRALYQQIDRKLLTALQQIHDDYRLADDADGRLGHWVYELREHESIFAVVYGANGGVRLRTQELAESSIPAAPTSMPDDGRLSNRLVPILGRQRVLEGRLRLEGADCAVLLMGSLAELDHELAELLTALLIAVPIALTLSGGVGYLLARKALAPVEQLRRQKTDAADYRGPPRPALASREHCG